MEQNLKCPRCGTLEEEWKEEPDQFVAEAYRCPGCEKLDWELHSWREETNAKGVYARLVKPDLQERLMIPLSERRQMEE